MVADDKGVNLRDYIATTIDVENVTFPDFETAAEWLNVDPPNENDFIDMLEFSFKLEAKIRYAKAAAMVMESWK
jgi:hypothetical protein